jgi:hypothetical protein
MTGSSLAPLIIPITGDALPYRVADPGVVVRPPNLAGPASTLHAGPRRRAQFRAIFEAER